MCGIAGFWHPAADAAEDVLTERARLMGAALHHRGPDDAGTFVDRGLAFAHQRLAVIDTSPGGHQPMLTPDERHVLVYDGDDRQRRRGIEITNPRGLTATLASLDVEEPAD